MIMRTGRVCKGNSSRSGEDSKFGGTTILGKQGSKQAVVTSVRDSCGTRGTGDSSPPAVVINEGIREELNPRLCTCFGCEKALSLLLLQTTGNRDMQLLRLLDP